MSICTVGCNLKCIFCQNWEISHPKEIFGEKMSPKEIIEFNNKHNSPGIAYTYTEPTIFYEYAYDIMKLAKKQGLYNVWVSNGFTNIEPIRKIAKYLDAINVDMKGDIKFYQKLCSIPNEDPIKQALKEYKKQKVWIEITNLIIPGYNDKKEQIKNLVEWIKNNLGPDTPLHFSRFYPHYKLLNVKPTPVQTLEQAVKIAKENGMNYVYLGNVPGHKYENTYCPECNTRVIERFGISVSKLSLKCEKCGKEIPIFGKEWIVKT
ncbi:MAG: AmmeMemoRadiSam system radical SAM enzyme [Candidatus Aenigmatarchaeota archaeon]